MVEHGGVWGSHRTIAEVEVVWGGSGVAGWSRVNRMGVGLVEVVSMRLP